MIFDSDPKLPATPATGATDGDTSNVTGDR